MTADAAAQVVSNPDACTARHLDGGRSVRVRVVPERAGRMVSRDVDVVFAPRLWRDIEKHIVAVSGRRDMESMEAVAGLVGRSVAQPQNVLLRSSRDGGRQNSKS